MYRVKHLIISLFLATGITIQPADAAPDFRTDIAPIFARHCLSCHNDTDRRGDLSLESATDLEQSGYVDAGKPASSHLLDVVTPAGGKVQMPKDADPLSEADRNKLSAWIAAGGRWPAGVRVAEARVSDTDWWSLKPLTMPAPPELDSVLASRIRTPVDRFWLAKLAANNLSPAAEADRRTLIRRLYFDLLGLSPAPEAVNRFVSDDAPRAYERLVDELLASPHYGERWARHWMDVVHYADTHGFDKDKVRPHAWPYRDYLIRAFNHDRPYARFVQEQLAGDVLWPHSADGPPATGMLAAGPFDFVGQIEVREGTMEKARVRNLDRDDMVRTVIETFCSSTIGCARCHNHKFDPFTQEDYYSLQAVFAGVDRADRAYDPSPEVAARRGELLAERAALQSQQQQLTAQIAEAAGPKLAALDEQLAALREPLAKRNRPEFGYHSRIEARQQNVKWVQVDLGRALPIDEIVYVGCHDDFNGIGAGFGFPLRYRIELSDDAEFAREVTTVLDRTTADVPNPGVQPQRVQAAGRMARYVRVTATRLAPRRNDFIFALAELIVRTPDGRNAAAGRPVASLDSIEAPVRWRRANLVDGIAPEHPPTDLAEQRVRLTEARERLLAAALSDAMREQQRALTTELSEVDRQLAALPARQQVYAVATDFKPQGNFRPTGGSPRPIHLLHRGEVHNRRAEVSAGAIQSLDGLSARFTLPEGHGEGERRAALARWISDRDNPLTWRSISNRVWYYHFGRGLVETPGDFGRMGALPSHPELLDWLSVWFRDEAHGSLKSLHRLIVTSSVYRQSSAIDAEAAAVDSGNRLLWRQHRRRLEAEAVRDAVLQAAGKLRPQMYGPGFRAFGFKDDHSPHYKYHEHDPDDPTSHRRSVYRFIVRSVPDPFMETLDCADPSLIVARRNETNTPLQALAGLNNDFMVRMAEYLAARVTAEADSPAAQIDRAVWLTLARGATDKEQILLVPIARDHGLTNVCRILLNTNEFLFVD